MTDSISRLGAALSDRYVIERERALLGGRFTTSSVTNWDVAPDGRSFVMVRAPDAALE